MADDAAGKPPEMTAFSAVTEVDIVTGGDGNETFVIDPSAFSEGLTLVEVIADYTEGQDVLDLSDLLASLGALPSPNAGEFAATADPVISESAALHVDSNGVASGGLADGASLTGVHATISILYDENQTNHTPTVT
jgi:hypothetical protein